MLHLIFFKKREVNSSLFFLLTAQIQINLNKFNQIIIILLFDNIFNIIIILFYIKN